MTKREREEIINSQSVVQIGFPNIIITTGYENTMYEETHVVGYHSVTDRSR